MLTNVEVPSRLSLGSCLAQQSHESHCDMTCTVEMLTHDMNQTYKLKHIHGVQTRKKNADSLFWQLGCCCVKNQK